jgi:flagellar biosynthesis protein FliQ
MLEVIILVVLFLNFGWMLKRLEDIKSELIEIKKQLGK